MASVSISGDTSGSITISAPLVAGSGTLTLPVATDTLIGKATTDTLTNKTLTTPVINGFTGDTSVINIGSGQIYKDASGNVGIGTASPAQMLDLVKTTASATQVRFKNSATANGLIVGVTAAGDSLIYNGDASNLAMYTNATERMRIDSSGNLLVGTTTIGFTNSRSFNFQGLGDGKVYVNHSTANSSGDGYIGFGYNGGQIGSITQNGTTAVAYNTSSDYRLKENIAPMTGALSTVSQLKPVTYSWKADGSDGQGFIAHELQAVVPDCVSGEKDAVDAEGNPIHQGIDTSFLVATLTAALQEAHGLIKDLQSRVDALEAK
jgi:hypothetical protein